MESFIANLKEEALPGVWSKGIQLARNPKRIEPLRASESSQQKELKFKIQTAERMLAFQVTLWPEDQDTHCNCGSKTEPCHHIIAVALAYQAGHIETPEAKNGSTLLYNWAIDFNQNPPELRLERTLLWGSEKISLTPSLISMIGGIQSGRLKIPLPPTTPLDLKIDDELTPKPGTPSTRWKPLLKLLKELPPLPLEKPLNSITHLTLGDLDSSSKVFIEDAPGGFSLKKETVFFSDSALKLQSGLRIDQGVLHWQEPQARLGVEKEKAIPHFIPFEKQGFFLHQTLPELQNHFEVIFLTKKFSKLVEIEPKIELKINPLGSTQLGITPVISYGELPEGQIARRDPRGEAQLIKALRQDFHLGINQTTCFDAKSAFEFQKKWLHTYPEAAAPVLDQFLTDTLGELKAISNETFFTHRDEVLHLLSLKQNGNLNGSAKIQAKNLLLSLPSETEIHPQSLQSPPELKLPTQLWQQLRTYQKQGVAWMNEHAIQNSGLILADDMGLGKTLQTLCVLRPPALIILPTSLLNNWKQEIMRFRPDLSFQTYHGQGRAWREGSAITLTTYGILRSETPFFQDKKWNTLILDEAHWIRNRETQASAAALSLNAPFKIALTGTPIQNRMSDLWTLLQFIAPDLFSNQTQLKKELIKPFLLRRTKTEVLPELPPKTYLQQNITLTDEERKSYEAVWASTKNEVLAKIAQGQKLSPLSIFEVLLRCRQNCNHPGLYDPNLRTKLSSKLSRLLELCEELMEAGHSILVYSQWTQFLDLIQTHFTTRELPFLRLDGSTQNRGAVVDAFQNDKNPKTFLLSLHAGGVGLNLTRATHVIFCDPWWNPFVELQAEDRAYRMGQEKPVTIHRLITEDSIEEKLLLLQEEKKKLGEVAEGSTAHEIDPEQMMKILF